jgi:hypothetical protein
LSTQLRRLGSRHCAVPGISDPTIHVFGGNCCADLMLHFDSDT